MILALSRAMALALIVAGLAASGPGAARAEATEVRIADQIGLLYLPLRVVVERKLIEKKAAEAGLGDVKVSLLKFSGGGAVNTALLSGGVDFAAGGVPPLLKLWDRTRGGDKEVRGAVTLTFMAYKLFTIDPAIQSLEDYAKQPNSRIALPSVKVSTQAVTLQMAAEKTFGAGKAFELDDRTVSMPHPQAIAAMRSGGLGGVKNHFATLPFSYELRREIKARQILSSYDVAGGPHAGVVLYNTRKWKDENPKFFKAVVDAFLEAHEWIDANPRETAELFKKTDDSRATAGQILEMIQDRSEVDYRPDVKGTMVYAEFLNRVGDVKVKPGSWKDYFWENLHGFEGD